MKCRSVACVWSASPFPHRVTATAVLSRPPTLYTGGSDGSIIWWTLSGDPSHMEIKPMAMLCGHAAPIADLGNCYPVVVSGDVVENSSNVEVNSTLVDSGALISACTDGVLCVWSRGSGHCRRRRKLPPWVGSPSVVRTLPSKPRYLCIACCFVDSVHSPEHHSADPAEGFEAEEYQHRKPPKCTLIIVDSYTLSIVQTVFNGNLSIGPLKFMSVVSSVEDREKQSAIMADSFGKVQLVPILKDFNMDGEGGTSLHKSSSLPETSIWADGLRGRGKIASIASCEQIFALVYKTCCEFRLVDSGTIIGEISFTDSCLFCEEGSIQSHVVGGMFLESGDAASSTQDAKRFAVWNNRGSVVVYILSYLNDIFKFEPLFGIPAVSWPLDVELSIFLVNLNSLLLRIVSICFHIEEPFLWSPHVTIWSLCPQVDDNRKLWRQCKMLGEGGFFVDRAVTSTSLSKIEGPMHNVGMETTSGDINLVSGQSFVPSSKNVNNIWEDNENSGLMQKGRIVSSSMVISEYIHTPYAIVYGFYSGEIELVRFDQFFPRLDSSSGSPRLEIDSNESIQCFSGHVGAVLCLAAHQMVGMSKGWSFNKVLISGSLDCTIRIWDLDTSNLILVMHQHVAPVRQIILPSPPTERPWNDCFLSVGEDSCVALASLETLRVERMFPGHPNYPAKVVWDGARGYIACLCLNYSGNSDAIDVLYIWDLKTGARERILRGPASHSMFDHFCRSITINSISGSVLSGNTSVSSLHLPIIEDTSSKNTEKLVTSLNMVPSITNITEANASQAHASKGNSSKPLASKLSILQGNNHPIKCSCPFPGIATLSFDLASVMSFFQKHESMGTSGYKQENTHVKEQSTGTSSPHHMAIDDVSDLQGTLASAIEEHDWVRSLEGCLLRFSLSFLHLWNVDFELDKLLITEMKLKRPDKFIVASGLRGDSGSLTVTFPGLAATLELWRSSSEFCAMRSLTMVSLAQRMISLSQTSSAASSALAAFYTRNFAEKIPDIKPPLLQLLVSFWQDKSEHVRMAARSLFHCAASRAIPLPLCSQKAFDHAKFVSFRHGMEENENRSNKEETSTAMIDSDRIPESRISQLEESKILAWLESYEVQDWISCVGGTSQDAMTSHIIVAAALAIWYPSLVKPGLSILAVHPLVKLVMAMTEKYSSTAAELLAEGLESTWKAGIGLEIPRLIGDIFFQIECVSGASNNLASQKSAASDTIRETLIGILLPSLGMADIPGFLSVIESQIWSTASDSPVHLVSLMTLIRVVRGSPKSLAQYLDKIYRW
ncbi:uncharacterized protein LOC131158232 isoform X2 [Malania oleifera]|uniref:uncharacterized protein LOC131158232 isoform X2 n=1 Tax=Malania oleifera TaxID=397392 RepID=UPI0025ADA087|nr:uncharacterized protein LOC131158232 isoform X2 [Malania oleifera]